MHWFQSICAPARSRGRQINRRSGSCRLSVEILESRWTPSGTPIQVLSLLDDRGQNLIGQITRDNTPKITGTGPASTTLTIDIGGQQQATVFTNWQGKWSYQVVRPLQDGTLSIQAALSNNNQIASQAVSFTVDTTAPVVQVNAPLTMLPNSNLHVQTNDAGGVASVWLDIQSSTVARFAKGQVGYAQLQPGNNRLPDLPAGMYFLRVRAVDQVGNSSTSAPFRAYVQGSPMALGDTWLIRLASLGNNVPAAKPTRTPTALDTLNQISDDKLREMFYIDGNRVLVAARAKQISQTDAFLHALVKMGMQVIDVTRDSALITGWLNASQIPDLLKVPNFSAATAVTRHVTRAGSIQTQGDAVINGAAFRLGEGVDGFGQKVGVISDSVNQVGGGIAASQATGDLPPVVQVLQDFVGGSDEGRAMLEIVHDVAPGAALAFHTAVGGAAVFANAIRALAAAGCNVIVDDIGYFNSPVYNAGRMGQAVEEVWRQGVFYATAAGNDGDFAWRGNFSPIRAQVGTINGVFNNFGGSVLQPFTLPVGQFIDFKFNWDNPYLEGGSPLPNYQVTADLAVHVVNLNTGAILATFNTNNLVTDEAYERILFLNLPAFGTNSFAFAFQLVAGTAPSRITWIDIGSSVPTINVVGEGASTIYGQVLAENAMAVGAVDWVTPNVPEVFSSLGGNLPIVADDLTGARFATPQIRQKPNVMGPDGVSTTLAGFSPFFGTSAAAPHIAAAAALLLQQATGSTNANVFEHLEGTSIPLPGTNGFDAKSGWGRVFLRPLVLGQDSFDPNISSERATPLGVLNGTLVLNGLTIQNFRTGLPDYDWFLMQPARVGSFSASINNNRLQVFQYVRRGGYLYAVPQGYQVRPGDLIYVQVKGRPLKPGLMGKGVYDLTLQLI